MTIPLADILVTGVSFFFQILSFLIIIRIFMSWLAPGSNGAIAEFVYATTEPVLGVFRQLPLRIGVMDFTPLATLIALDIARYVILTILARFFA